VATFVGAAVAAVVAVAAAMAVGLSTGVGTLVAVGQIMAVGVAPAQPANNKVIVIPGLSIGKPSGESRGYRQNGPKAGAYA